jgi:hypothetical protein
LKSGGGVADLSGVREKGPHRSLPWHGKKTIWIAPEEHRPDILARKPRNRNFPPRCGKTIITSVCWIAWTWARRERTFSSGPPLLDRGYGRPAQSLDLHLSADAITKRLSDMTDAELAALEQRMIAAAPIVLEATAEVSDDAGELPDGDAAQDGDDCGDGCVDDAAAGDT